MSGALTATVEGIGFWARGLPSWSAARAYCRSGALPTDAPPRPAPDLLAPNERRRASPPVAVVLEVAAAACEAAGRAPASLPSVFTSTHGDLSITDYMCTTLAREPLAISPTRFHNSVHNAAAGYWTIGAHAMHAATAISAYDASFAQGLLEAMVQLASGTDAVLLVACDGKSVGPLTAISPSDGLLGAALVLSRQSRAGAPRLQVEFGAHSANDGTDRVDAEPGPLARFAAGNAMAPMLPLLDALASGIEQLQLHAGPGNVLRVRQLMTQAEPTGA